MRAVLIAHGQPPSIELARKVCDGANIVMAADGAAMVAHQLGVIPTHICGDFDSISYEDARRLIPTAEVIHTPNQNLGDLEKAVNLLVEMGVFRIDVIGGLGQRWDHSLSNIGTIDKFCNQVKICMHEEDCTVFPIQAHSEITIWLRTNRKDLVSVIALQPDTVVSYEGLQWTMERSPLQMGTHGISNVAIKEDVAVTVHHGTAVIFHYHGSLDTVEQHD